MIDKEDHPGSTRIESLSAAGLSTCCVMQSRCSAKYDVVESLPSASGLFHSPLLPSSSVVLLPSILNSDLCYCDLILDSFRQKDFVFDICFGYPDERRKEHATEFETTMAKNNF